MEESFVNSCINTAFDTENMYELDTKPLPFITGKWNYLGKIHIKRSLRRSFAYKVVNKQKIYCNNLIVNNLNKKSIYLCF